jgi:transcriptional regulator with XRE-family HTH domain
MSKQGGWPASGFADRLRELREQACMSQAQLAERVGVHTLSISKLERGVHEPLWPLVLAIANALGKPVQEFIVKGGKAPGDASRRPRGRPRKAAGGGAEPAPPATPSTPPAADLERQEESARGKARGTGKRKGK